MGENEQGGMLRVVIVVGLIAILITAVFGGLAYVKASSSDNVSMSVKNTAVVKAGNQTNYTDDAATSKFTYTDYNASAKTVTITGLKAVNGVQRGQMIIPAHVVNGGVTYDVTAIGDSAFDNLGMSSVIFPKTLKTIGASAFHHDISIQSLSIPDSVISVGEDAFYGDSNLQYVRWSPNTSVMSRDVFGSTSIREMTIPEGVTKIEELAITGGKLTKISLPSTLTFIDTNGITAGGDLVVHKGNTGITYPSGSINVSGQIIYE